MSHSKTKFNNSWLKKKDSNGHLLEWWCKSHDSDKFKAVCKLCDKEIQVANNGCFALMQHAKQNMHNQKAVVQNISEEAKTSKQVAVFSTSTSEPNHQILQNRRMTREKQLEDMKEANSH